MYTFLPNDSAQIFNQDFFFFFIVQPHLFIGLFQWAGMELDHQIIVIAATNRADVLDPALTRPGRFDRQVHVPLHQAFCESLAFSRGYFVRAAIEHRWLVFRSPVLALRLPQPRNSGVLP